ncbi:MAG: HEAT repeat domain-containing protein [Planctomycetes bacterium]|nr:HEAT repeat domain-containing protein [Planctomycetota bacterium]
MRAIRLFAAGAAISACAGIFPLLAQDAEPDVTAQVADRFQRLGQAQGSGIWNEAMALESLGEAAAPEIARRLGETTNPAVQVAAAKALLGMNADAQRSAAIRALKNVVRGNAGRNLRILACDLLTQHAHKNDVKSLIRALDQITDPMVKTHLLVALHHKGRWPRARRELRKLLKSEDFGVKAEAALALASPEIGNVELVRPILRQLQGEPSDRGRRAQAYLEQDDLLSKLEKYEGLEKTSDILKLKDKKISDLKGEVAQLRAAAKKGGGKASPGAGGDFPGGKLLDEIFTRIREGYVDEKKTKVEDLVDKAASGLVDELDPFSSYMSARQLASFNEGMGQVYGGVGAVVQMDPKSGYLTIQQIFYGNPAHKAGLRALDKIIEVEGVTTKGKTVSELVKLLKGPENTPVRVLVRPFLGGDDVELTIIRQQVTVKSVHTAMLPGKIGYLQLQQFGGLAVQEIEAGLKTLEAQGMQGLIFDLRGNPGGYLNAAVLIADKFLNDDQLVTYSQGRKGTRYGFKNEDGGPRVKQSRVAQPKHPDYPMVVLINGDSASASEIVSGALQAHSRADLVGETSFGKGSVQNVFPLQSTGGKAALRLTIAYYYLPDGRLIHRKRDAATWRFLQQIRSQIRGWKANGVITDAQSKKMLERYKDAPGGVEPDYTVSQPELSKGQSVGYGLVLASQIVDLYVQARWNEHKKLFHTLAKSDGFKTDLYPDFDELWAEALKIVEPNKEAKAVFSKEDLRVLLRAGVRRFAQDDFERILVGDFQQDVQLQAGLVVLAEATGIDTTQIAELKFLKERYPKGVEKTRKPKEPKKGEDKGRDFK